ncbi:NmrA/HSCARG family protein [Lutimonas saemankumensis]|uniref:NmrA/HSCARG family protein n=1 Tax=Lutimonas saemankumensis TaxID=483016 RepID=UPI001CD4168A|nr:NmrA/HSCARG family protein [Lutimonas saemankumensis]MCA0933636.1 NmrA/HSCARG family protein [Lutimonas saemankumensis]
MEDSKSVFITGITGNQGGALAKHLSETDIRIVGLTRDSGSVRAKNLVAQGVEIVEGDLDNHDSFKETLSDIDIFFLVQGFEQGAKKEIEQAQRLVDLIKEYHVPHLVYSSVLGADLNTGIPHFESKYIVENYIKNSQLDYTTLRPASFMENLLNQEVLKRLKKGKLVLPLNKNTIQQLISTEDIGKVAARIITTISKYKGQTLNLVTDQKSAMEQAEAISKVLNKPVTYQKLPGIFTYLFMGKDLFKMFSYMNKNNFIVMKDIDAFKKEFKELGDFEYWVESTLKLHI